MSAHSTIKNAKSTNATNADAELEVRGAGVEADGRWLVQEATLSLRPQALTAFVGPNGAGKTTLLRLLAGLWQPTAGAVLLGGRFLDSFSRRELARRIAYAPQDTHMEFAFTVRDCIAAGRHPHLGRFDREGAHDRRAIDDAMHRADVSHLAARLVTELSGGERQRVALARSLATEAGIILLDEPVANLDIGHALDLLDLCRELTRAGKTIIVALHDLNLAARYASDLVMLAAGRIIAADTPAAVLTDDRLARVFGVRPERLRTATGEMTFHFRRDRTHDAGRQPETL